MTAVATIAVCIRMYVRTQIVRSMGPDDYIILIALVCRFAPFITCVRGGTESSVGDFRYGLLHRRP